MKIETRAKTLSTNAPSEEVFPFYIEENEIIVIQNNQTLVNITISNLRMIDTIKIELINKEKINYFLPLPWNFL